MVLITEGYHHKIQEKINLLNFEGKKSTDIKKVKHKLVTQLVILVNNGLCGQQSTK